MRRPTFLRVYSSDATEKDDEATPINRSDSDDVRNSMLPIQVHPPGGKQGLTAALGCLAWAGVRRVVCRPPEKSPERRVLINNR